MGSIGVNTTPSVEELLIHGRNGGIGSTEGNVGVYTVETQAADRGAMIALGGQDGGGARTFAAIHGRKENSTSGNPSGYFAITTRGAASLNEALRITSLGNLGLGTTAPSGRLHVAGGELIVGPLAAGSGNSGRLQLRELAANGTNGVSLRAADTMAANYTLTLPAATGASGQFLATDASGNLSWATNPGGTLGWVHGGNSFGQTGTLGTNDNFALALKTNNNTRMTITADGHVGIGLTAPSSVFGVRTDTGVYGITQTNGTVTVGTWVGTNPGIGLSGQYGTWTNHPLAFFTNNQSPQMTLLTNGNLGLGTTAPSGRLHIEGGEAIIGPLAAGAGNAGRLQLRELAANGTNGVSLRAPDALAGNVTLTLPAATGASGQLLTTDASGNLSWVTNSGGSLNWAHGGNSFAQTGTLGTNDNYGLVIETNNIQRVQVSATGVLTYGTAATAAGPEKVVFGDRRTTETATGWAASFRQSMFFAPSAASNTQAITQYIEANKTGAQSTQEIIATLHDVTNSGGNVGRIVGAQSVVFGSGGNTTEAVGFATYVQSQSGTINQYTGFVVDGPTATTGLLRSTGLRIADQAGSVEQYGIYQAGADDRNYFAGTLGLGTTAPSGKLHVHGGEIIAGPVSTGAGNAGRLHLRELAANGTNSVSLRSPDALAGNVTLTLPAATGASGQLLTTDASGNLSWITNSGGSLGWAHGGNSFAQTGTLGTNDNYALAFETNNNTRMTITSGGSVGIGTSTPTGDLTVSRSNQSTSLEVLNTTTSGSAKYPSVTVSNFMNGFGSGHPVFNFMNANGTQSSPGRVQNLQALGSFSFSGWTAANTYSPAATIASFAPENHTASSSPGVLVFNTTPSGSTTDLVRMMIAANGNVGIGTGTGAPSGRLHIDGGELVVGPVAAGAGNSGRLTLRELAANGTNGVSLRAADAMAANYTLTLPAATGTSGQLLATNASGQLSWVTNSGGTLNWAQGGNSFAQNGTLGTNDNYPLVFETNNNARMTITSGGSIGIGTSSPMAKLDVRGTGANVAAAITNTDSNVGGAGAMLYVESYGASGQPGMQLNYHRGTGASPQPVQNNDWVGFLQFQGFGTSNYSGRAEIRAIAEQTFTNANGGTQMSFTTTALNTNTAVERMTIRASGNVGIGTTAPSGILHLVGTTTANSALVVPVATQAARPSSPINGMIRYNTDTNKFEAREAGAWVNMIGGSAYTGGGTMWVITPNGEDIRTATGNWVKINSDNSNPAAPLHVVGGAMLEGDVSLEFNDGGVRKWYDGWGWSNNMGSSGTYTFSGAHDVRVGINNGYGTAAVALDVNAMSAAHSAIRIPRGNNTRPTGSSGALVGMMRYNTAINKFEAYENGAWVNMISAGGGDFLRNGSLAMTGNFNAGGNRIVGNSTSGGRLLLESTSHGTKGHISLHPDGINSGGGWVGIGTQTPEQTVHIVQNWTNTDATLRVQNTATGAGASSVLFLDANTGDAFSYYTSGASTHNWTTGIDVSDGSKYKISATSGAAAPGTGDLMTITTGGSVGIGTTSPASILHVHKATADTFIDVSSSAANANAGISFTARGGSTNRFGNIFVDWGANFIFNGDAGGYVFRGSGDTGGVSFQDGTAIFEAKGVDGSLDVTSTAANANVAIGLQSRQGGTTRYGWIGADQANTITLSSRNALYRFMNAADNAAIATVGTAGVSAPAFLYTSDRTLKKDIRDVEGLELIMKLSGRRFNWISNGQPEIGLIAQEVEEFAPELVVTNPDTNKKSVKYGNLVAPLIESTKELYGLCRASEAQWAKLSEQVSKNTRDIASVRAENEDLKKRVERLEKLVEQLIDEKAK